MEKIQFTGQDILDWLSKTERLPNGDTLKVLSTVNHEILNAYHSTIGMSNLILNRLKNEENPDKIRNAYLENIINMLAITKENHTDIITLTRKKYFLTNILETKGKEWPPEVREYMQKEAQETINTITQKSSGIRGTLDSLIYYSPLTTTIDKTWKIEGMNKELMETTDFLIYNLVSMLNDQYSPIEVERKTYNLKNAVDAYYIRQVTVDPKLLPKLMAKPGLPNIMSEENYFPGVLNVFIDNSAFHGYNKKNDLYDKLKNPDFEKTIEIWYKDNTEDKELEIHFRDNGCGMPDDVKNRVFEEGFSTKTDTSREHGIGLARVKEFVENNGGKVWVDSEIGKYTEFAFTIPYKIENDIYIHEKRKKENQSKWNN